MRLHERRYDLVGGSDEDRAAAAKWISMFMKNDVVHGFPPTITKKPTQPITQNPDCL